MLHLLVVEDEDVYRQFLVLALRLEGYSVSTVENEEAALDFLHANAPDLVILDLSMPNSGGWHVLRFIRGTAPLDQTPVLVLTANADADTRRRSYEAGATRLLVKPVSLDEILEAIDGALPPA
jgi:CheY-like chemotaxis protein